MLPPLLLPIPAIIDDAVAATVAPTCYYCYPPFPLLSPVISGCCCQDPCHQHCWHCHCHHCCFHHWGIPCCNCLLLQWLLQLLLPWLQQSLLLLLLPSVATAIPAADIHAAVITFADAVPKAVIFDFAHHGHHCHGCTIAMDDAFTIAAMFAISAASIYPLFLS